MELMKVDGQATMDSREIADLLNARHADVFESISTQLPKAGYTAVPYTYTHPQNGRKYQAYKLPFRETMIVVSGYSVELRAKVVDRWMELEAQQKPRPLAGMDLIAAAVIEAQKVIARQAEQIEAQKPAVQFMADVTGSRDAIEMGQAAKIIGMGMGRNRLFEFLRDNGVLRDNNEPYQKYIDAGWFRIVEQSWKDSKGETHINIKTMVYQKGIDGIIKLIRTAS